MIGTIMTVASLAIIFGLCAYGLLIWKRSKLAALLLIVVSLGWGTAWQTVRPHLSIQTPTGSDVIRVDVDGAGSHDVRYIYTAETEFRNEDTWWWLKRDTGPLTNTANQMRAAGESGLFMSYGLRFPLFSMYPNVVAINPVGYSWIFFSIYTVLLLLPFAGAFYVARKIAGRSNKAAT